MGKTVKNKRNYYFTEDPRLIGEMIKEKDRLFSLFAKRKIAIIAHKEEIALIVESQQIYTALLSIFKFMWKNLPKENVV